MPIHTLKSVGEPSFCNEINRNASTHFVILIGYQIFINVNANSRDREDRWRVRKRGEL